MGSILIAAEMSGQQLDPIAAELVAAALKAASGAASGGEVAVAVLGDDPGPAAEAAAGLGVDRVYSVTHEALKDGGTGGFDAPVTALTELCKETSPEAVLVAKTDFGSNVGPRLAFRLGAAFAQDCIDLAVDAVTGRIAVTRPVHGGNAMAVYQFGDSDPQVVSIRPGVFEPAASAGSRAEVVSFDVSQAVGNVRSRLVETGREERAGVRLEDAEVVVSGGRGLGGPAPFERLEELAELLNGAVGASRAACDAGWIDHSRQIGLTGKSISPRVYITFGISGASQHMAGCSGAKSIVAVNKDADANIFKEARFGVVGDWERVCSGFMATLQDLVDA